MFGWIGTVLEIDLSSGKIIKKAIETDFARKWIGGEGFGAKILWDEVGPEVQDGLDPRNVLIFATGPLNGTMAPSSGRLEIITKSPLTGIFGDSNAGGHLAPELKEAGYDLVVIKGKAPKPVYIWIDDEIVEIRDAARLWGKTIPETDTAIKDAVGDKDIQVSCIGPGGENLVRFAVIMNNLTRAPGRTGTGAVAGSKNLKALAVRGTRGIRIARPSEFEKACWEAREKVRKNPHSKTLARMGTMYLFRQLYVGGYTPFRNYSQASCSLDYYQKVSGEKFVETFTYGRRGCHGCEVQCDHLVAIKEGQYQGVYGGGFEFGCICPYVFWYGCDNLDLAIAATRYCNDNGIDGAEPGALLAWATDCYKRGILTKDDTDGLELDWGDEKIALTVLGKINHREGFGDLLAEGLGRAARKLGRGSEYFAQTVKGRPSFEAGARATYGTALAAVTSTRGADHLKGYPHFEYAALPEENSLKRWGHRKTGDGRSPEGKAPMTAYDQALHTIMDMLGTCKFHTRLALEGVNEEDYALLLSCATGLDITAPELMVAADRVYNLERAYDARLGITRKDDTLPEMYFTQPLQGGPLSGQLMIDRAGFNLMLDDYYRHRGWDVATGVPNRDTLERLDLREVADDLESGGLMPGQGQKR